MEFVGLDFCVQCFFPGKWQIPFPMSTEFENYEQDESSEDEGLPVVELSPQLSAEIAL